MESRDIIIKKIKYYRELKKISPEELSYRIGKNKEFIKQVEQAIFTRAENNRTNIEIY